jgi:hypothetical protein
MEERFGRTQPGTALDRNEEAVSLQLTSLRLVERRKLPVCKYKSVTSKRICVLVPEEVVQSFEHIARTVLAHT